MDELTLSEESQNRFTSHVADPDRVHQMRAIRAGCRVLASAIESIVPAGRDRATALTHLQSVMMFSNAGICENLPRDPKDVFDPMD